MGYKLLRDTYKIEHIVQVCDKEDYGGRVICIGSPSVHDLIVINMEGEIVKRNDGRNNNDLRRYMQEFDADSEKLKRIVQTPDSFDAGDLRSHFIKSPYRKVIIEDMYPNSYDSSKSLYANTINFLNKIRRDKRENELRIELIEKKQK